MKKYFSSLFPCSQANFIVLGAVLGLALGLTSCGTAEPDNTSPLEVENTTMAQNGLPSFDLSASANLSWKAVTNTRIKLKPMDSSTLSSGEFCEIPKGVTLQMSWYPIEVKNNHYKVFLADAIPGCSIKVGYVFLPHFVTLPGQAPTTVNLDVPYFAQRNNKNEPGRTCNLTALAMALQNLKIRVTPDNLFEDSWGHRNGETGAVFDSVDMVKIARQYGAKGSYMLPETNSESIKLELRQGNTVVLQGYFSNWEVGHILLIKGYDATGWFLNDSAGKWNGNTGKNPYGADHFNGKNVHYTYAQVSANSLAGKDKYRVAVIKR